MGDTIDTFCAESETKSLTPYLCRPSSNRVLKPVRRTPAQTGISNSMFNAKAVPITVSK